VPESNVYLHDDSNPAILRGIVLCFGRRENYITISQSIGTQVQIMIRKNSDSKLLFSQ
jgi:hypothetical protein